MSYADRVFVQNVKDILENGVWDTDKEVRPKWLDGTPAHTIKKFCLVNRYRRLQLPRKTALPRRYRWKYPHGKSWSLTNLNQSQVSTYLIPFLFVQSVHAPSKSIFLSVSAIHSNGNPTTLE